jgi:hypothetical protein
MFSIACFKEAVVADHLKLSGAFHKWNVNFLRAAHDWEVNHFILFFNLLHSFRLRQDDEEKLCWIHSKRGLFDVKSYYNVLVPHDSTLFPWRSIWPNKVLLRVAILLGRQHVIVVDWCCMCKKSGK